jgi:uncharacterized protein (TIGR03067 family)
MKLSICNVILCSGLCLASDANDSAVQKEVKNLQGTWSCVEWSREGKAAPRADLKAVRYTFNENRMTLEIDGKVVWVAEITPDLSKTPKVLEIKVLEPDIKKGTLLAIYELSDDKLKLCHPNHENTSPPREFKAPEKSDLFLITLHRTRK